MTSPLMVYNPNNVDEDTLPWIYGFNNGGSPGWCDAVAIAQDGTVLGAHICSSEVFMPHDLGLIRDSRLDRQEFYRSHYPGGYRATFISLYDVRWHAGLTAAVQKNEQAARLQEDS